MIRCVRRDIVDQGSFIHVLTTEHAKIIKKFVNPVAIAMYFLSAALWAPIIVFCCDRPNAKPVHSDMSVSKCHSA